MLALETNLMSNDQIRAIDAMKDLFKVANLKKQLWITGADDGCSFEVPILPDIYGNTPLDICLGIVNRSRKGDKSKSGKIFKTDKDNQDDITATENLAMVEVIFCSIKDYGFLHSSHFITDAVIEATR